MTRSERIVRLARRFTHLVIQDAEVSAKMLLDSMSDALVRGDRIEIRGFWSFGFNHRPGRIGRNPASGETVVVTAK